MSSFGGESRVWTSPNGLSSAESAEGQPEVSAKRAARRTRERTNRLYLDWYLRESLRRGRAPTEDLLRKLNSFVLGSAPQSDGPYRTTKVVVRWRGRVVNRPPSPQLVAALMESVFETMSMRGGESAIERCARVYLAIMKIHPFKQGNGRTARAFVTYLLLRAGYRQRQGRSLEEYFDMRIEEYNHRLDLSSIDDPSPWSSFFRGAVMVSFRQPTIASRLRGLLQTGLLQRVADR